jgi:hypothetical protein
VDAFDTHRVGTHEYLWSPDREDGRRCLDAEEMKSRGMSQNDMGRWQIDADVERARRLHGVGMTPESGRKGSGVVQEGSGRSGRSTRRAS